MATILGLSMLCGCGEGQDKATTGQEMQQTAEKNGMAQSVDLSEVVGTYIYKEAAMGNQFTVDWELELKENGTYTLTEVGPMGENVYEGTYSYDGEIVTTGPFEGTVMAAFFEADNSCRWILEGESCMPAAEEADGSMDGADIGKPQASGSADADYSAVAYASNSASQVCDIYLPDGEGPYPVIIIYHGGGFMFGDQTMAIIQPVIKSSVEHGYAVVSADYRKSSEEVFPAAVSDAKAVVRFVRANAEEYGFDAEHIAVWGESAGAYLAAMTALTPGISELDGDVSDYADQEENVRVLVDFYGPIEFYTMDEEFIAMGQEENANHTTDSFECKFMGISDMSSDKDTLYQSYWETYVQAVPADLSVWIQAGTEDVQVPNTQSQNFAERISEVIGTDNVHFSLIEGAGHEDDLFYTDENLAQVFEFLDGVMK